MQALIAAARPRRCRGTVIAAGPCPFHRAVVEQPLQILARLRADPLDHRAALAYDDRLLGLGFDENRRVDAMEWLRPGRFLKLIDDDRRRVRQLVARVAQDLLADDFR